MFNRKKKPSEDDNVQQFNRLLETLTMLLIYVEKQCQLALTAGQVPLPQLYLIDLIYQRLSLLLAGDPELIKQFKSHTTKGISSILKALQEYSDDPEGSSLSGKPTFEELMKGLNISGININDTGVDSPEDLKKKFEDKKKPPEPKTDTDNKTEEEKKDEDKEKDNPSGSKDSQV